METKTESLKEMFQDIEREMTENNIDVMGVDLDKKEVLELIDALITKEEMMCPTKMTEGVKEHEVIYNSPYLETVDGMLSADYKERFKAEYQQTMIRYEKLKLFNTKIEAALLVRPKSEKCKMPKHDCPYDLLREQQKIMGEYLHLLELRAVIEGVEL